MYDCQVLAYLAAGKGASSSFDITERYTSTKRLVSRDRDRVYLFLLCHDTTLRLCVAVICIRRKVSGREWCPRTRSVASASTRYWVWTWRVAATMCLSWRPAIQNRSEQVSYCVLRVDIVCDCYRCLCRFLYISHWLIFWLTNKLADWLTNKLTDWLADWLADWLTDWFADWRTDWLTDWLFICGVLGVIFLRQAVPRRFSCGSMELTNGSTSWSFRGLSKASCASCSFDDIYCLAAVRSNAKITLSFVCTTLICSYWFN